jgi:hypothetical protein
MKKSEIAVVGNRQPQRRLMRKPVSKSENEPKAEEVGKTL